MVKTNLKDHQTALIWAIVVAALASLIPVIQIFFLPLDYLNTHIHEFCHAIVGVLTGGTVESIVVNANGSGETLILGGNLLLIAPAGYLGATALGTAIILCGSTPNRARAVLGAIAFVLSLSMIFWVRGDLVGILSGFGWIAVLIAGAVFLRGKAALFACQLIGLEQCLNSVTSIYQLLQLSVVGEVHSDASNMQTITHLPALLWATIWCGFSLLTIGFTARLIWKSGSPARLP
jgi:hypothetical protein